MTAIKDALGPLVTDTFEGVCCKSMQKLCYRLKEGILKPQKLAKENDATYEGWISPNYKDYIDNLGVCARIT